MSSKLSGEVCHETKRLQGKAKDTRFLGARSLQHSLLSRFVFPTFMVILTSTSEDLVLIRYLLY